MKNMYEIFDEFELAKNKRERLDVLQRNISKTLAQVLELTFDPQYQWLITEVPHGYNPRDIPAGMSYSKLSTELRKMYLFRKGDPVAEKLTPQKRTQLLVEYLDNLEPREAEVIMGIFNKDLCVRGLDYKFVKEAFPAMLP
jgi:hypothetical protein